MAGWTVPGSRARRGRARSSSSAATSTARNWRKDCAVALPESSTPACGGQTRRLARFASHEGLEVRPVAQRGEVLIACRRRDVRQTDGDRALENGHRLVAVAAPRGLLGGSERGSPLADQLHAAAQLAGHV